MKPTAKQLSRVRDFVNSQVDSAKVEDFDEKIGIYFLAFELISLAIAIVQIENRALNFNLGLVIFIIGGVLSFSYEIAKRLKSISFRFAVYKLLVIFVLSILAAFATMFPLFLWLIASPLIFGTQELELLSLFVVLLIALPAVYFIQKYTKHRHHVWLESLEKQGRKKYFQTKQEENRRTLLYEITDLAVPKGVETTFLVYIINLALVLSTFANQPFYEVLSSSVLSQPLLWASVLPMIIVFLVWYYYENKNKPVKLLYEFIRNEENSEKQPT